MPADFELRVDAAEEVHAVCLDVDLALVPGAVEAAELRVNNELLRGLLRQVAVAARKVDPADAEFSSLSVRQRAELADFENDISDVGERRPDGDGLVGAQALAARVGARLRGAVGVDDLPSAPSPGLDERVWEGFTGRHNVATQRIGEVHLGHWREGAEQHRGTEQNGDLGFAEDGDEFRARPDLLLGHHDHGAARHPRAVHLGDAAVVSQG